MNKLLTIVIPIYNTEQYFPRCIESLIVPDYMNQLEILIVIDGSPDNSLEVARRYEAQYPNTIRVINKENGGHGSTINKGLELATGRYFRVLDSDDWFCKENFALYLTKLSKATEDIVMTHLSKELVYQNSSVLEPAEGIIFDHIYDGTTYEYNSLPIDFFGMARCTYKTSLLKQYNLHLLEKTFFEDSFLHVFPLVFLKSFVFYDLVIYHYFLGRPGQSVSKDVALKNNEHWHKLIRQIVEFYNINKQVLSSKKEKFFFKVLRCYIQVQYSQMNKFDYKKSKQEFAKWDKYVSSLPFSSQVTDYKKRLYSLLPYFLYRSSYKLKFWMLSRTKRFSLINLLLS
jgi:glycosyltransferase involved in cell wall biosynthesis